MIAEGHGRGGRFVDNIEHLEPRQPARVLGRLATPLVEEGGDGDNHLTNGSQSLLGILFQAFEKESAEDFGRDVPAGHATMVGPSTHVAFEAIGVGVRRDDRALDRLLADDHAIVLEGHRAGREQVARPVRQRRRPPRRIQIGDYRKGRAEIDSDGRLINIALRGRFVCHIAVIGIAEKTTSRRCRGISCLVHSTP